MDKDNSDDDDTIWTIKASAKNPSVDIETLDEDDLASGDKVYYFLLNSSGKVSKSKSGAKDGDDYKFTVSGYQIDKVTLEK